MRTVLFIDDDEIILHSIKNEVPGLFIQTRYLPGAAKKHLKSYKKKKFMGS
jgi:hypothetical protein